MMRRPFVGTLLVAVSMVLGAPAAWAQDPIAKMGRGVVNILTSWVEIPKNIHIGNQQENPILGVASGVLKGAGMTLLRVGIGAFETITFPFPYPKDYVSVYESMEMPDYAWE